MILVWVTFMIGSGVMFGMAALVVDLGYGMLQVRAMQNGSDAGVMAATRLLAGSVAVGPGNSLVYVINNRSVHDKAVEYAQYNRPAGVPANSYPIAVEYQPCSGASPTPNWTASSNQALVSEVGGTRQAADGDLVPSWVCKLRVFTRVSYNSLFAGAIGHPSQLATARATARISGTLLPTVITDVWPITRWLCNGSDDDVDSADGCDDTEETPCHLIPYDPANPAPPCTFWDSNSDPQGDFKKFVDMSKYSGLAKAEGIPNRYQHLWGWPDPPNDLLVQFDPIHPGDNNKNVDIPYWVGNGWKGQVRGSDSDPLCTSPTLIDTSSTPGVVRDCANSRLELGSQGDIGNNIASQMREYINQRKEGNNVKPCGFAGANNPDNDFSTVTVFFWRYGEQDMLTNNDSIGQYDESRIWGHFGDTFPDHENQLKRIVVQRPARFKFCRGHVSSSNVQGFFVSFFDPDAPPTENPPSTVANAVSLVE